MAGMSGDEITHGYYIIEKRGFSASQIRDIISEINVLYDSPTFWNSLPSVMSGLRRDVIRIKNGQQRSDKFRTASSNPTAGEIWIDPTFETHLNNHYGEFLQPGDNSGDSLVNELFPTNDAVPQRFWNENPHLSIMDFGSPEYIQAMKDWSDLQPKTFPSTLAGIITNDGVRS